MLLLSTLMAFYRKIPERAAQVRRLQEKLLYESSLILSNQGKYPACIAGYLRRPATHAKKGFRGPAPFCAGRFFVLPCLSGKVAPQREEGAERRLSGADLRLTNAFLHIQWCASLRRSIQKTPYPCKTPRAPVRLRSDVLHLKKAAAQLVDLRPNIFLADGIVKKLGQFAHSGLVHAEASHLGNADAQT